MAAVIVSGALVGSIGLGGLALLVTPSNVQYQLYLQGSFILFIIAVASAVFHLCSIVNSKVVSRSTKVLSDHPDYHADFYEGRARHPPQRPSSTVHPVESTLARLNQHYHNGWRLGHTYQGTVAFNQNSRFTDRIDPIKLGIDNAAKYNYYCTLQGGLVWLEGPHRLSLPAPHDPSQTINAEYRYLD